ncbi:hypothetical protein Pla123a_20610 [Posidoniimonas polymericola]|uniref:Signal peptide prediction n=1 Tax=Posidoniimonas polymericola TaxID=2528002 RepID=A0A5C5YRP6_9BACT|nr:hypothetical protein [Posidoniimonas polymericola]TWT77400.1 hypothetical protein Pla123a_20610 [Posidoniimonas polymericola]
MCCPFARILKLVWASPYTLLGVLVGVLGLATGGGAQLRRGALEFHGGLVRWLLERVPGIGGAMAMTLGHTILGQTTAALDLAREHEHVHVRQFERWGPLMGPAYIGCSVWLWLRRSPRPYRDNPFEVEAYNHDDCRRPPGGWRA